MLVSIEINKMMKVRGIHLFGLAVSHKIPHAAHLQLPACMYEFADDFLCN